MSSPNPASLSSMKPLQRLAYHSVTTCAKEASVYGKCIAAHYKDVEKGTCKEEFKMFGQCVRKAMNRNW